VVKYTCGASSNHNALLIAGCDNGNLIRRVYCGLTRSSIKISWSRSYGSRRYRALESMDSQRLVLQVVVMFRTRTRFLLEVRQSGGANEERYKDGELEATCCMR
jgi:hypothetical protein